MDTILVDVKFSDTLIQTTVTSSSAVVHRWITRIKEIHHWRLSNLVVGLDVEWLPFYPPNDRNPIAIMQICVGRRCLIFQLIHADSIPESLANFLANPSFTFVGVGVEDDANKLLEDYNLLVEHTMDLADAAAAKFEFDPYKYKGLKKLAKELIGKEMPKPIHVTLSAWDAKELSLEQIEYACIDAYASFELGLSLRECIVPSSFENIVDGDHEDADSAKFHSCQYNIAASRTALLSISNQLSGLSVCNFCNCFYCSAINFPVLSSSGHRPKIYDF